jgi:hypothetical protein
LARRNALSVRHESFRADTDRLLAEIDRILRPPAAPAPQRESGYEVAGADAFLAVVPTAQKDQQVFLRRLVVWSVSSCGVVMRPGQAARPPPSGAAAGPGRIG